MKTNTTKKKQATQQNASVGLIRQPGPGTAYISKIKKKYLQEDIPLLFVSLSLFLYFLLNSHAGIFERILRKSNQSNWKLLSICIVPSVTFYSDLLSFAHAPFYVSSSVSFFIASILLFVLFDSIISFFSFSFSLSTLFYSYYFHF